MCKGGVEWGGGVGGLLTFVVACNQKRCSSVDDDCKQRLQALAEELGHSGYSKSALDRLRLSLLSAEERCAFFTQKNRLLRGIVEMDGTSLRKLRLGNSSTLRYFQAFGMVERERNRVRLFDLGRSKHFTFKRFVVV